jgi:hypothetical protein
MAVNIEPDGEPERGVMPRTVNFILGFAAILSLLAHRRRVPLTLPVYS